MEIYKKVYIKSEADLPKDGYYFVFDKHIQKPIFTSIKRGTIIFNPSAWLVMYDWYLLPVELPSDEEIEKEALKLYPVSMEIRYDYSFDANRYNRIGWINGATWMRDQITKQ